MILLPNFTFTSVKNPQELSPKNYPKNEVIRLKEVWAGYDSHEPILEDINLTVNELDFIGLIALMGEEKPH